MGIEAIAGGAALSGIGGAIKGFTGNAAVNRYIDPSAQENALVGSATNQYNQSLGLIDQQQNNLSSLDGLRSQALQGYGSVLDGSAFQANSQDLNNINNVRNSQIQLGTQDINRQLNNAVGQTQASAGIRGLRGQALAQLQGQNDQAAAQQIGNVVNQAGVQAAQSALQLPYQRVQAQQQAMQTGLTYQDQLTQQALANRQAAANPALLSYYQNNRAQQGSLNTPASGGGFLNGLTGAISGAGAGAGLGASIANGVGQYNYLSGLGGNNYGATGGTAANTYAGQPYIDTSRLNA